jgi:hypothetical protein
MLDLAGARRMRTQLLPLIEDKRNKHKDRKKERTDLADTITPTALFFAPVQKSVATSPTQV